MKRIVNIDFSTNCKKASTALKRFFAKYPEHEEAWREEMEYMLENGIECETNALLGDGTTHPFTWAIHAFNIEDFFYFAIIERE